MTLVSHNRNPVHDGRQLEVCVLGAIGCFLPVPEDKSDRHTVIRHVDFVLASLEHLQYLFED